MALNYNPAKYANISALILAAGYSGRMKAFKPLLEIEGKSFLQSIVEKLLPVCNNIIVVTGFKKEEIEKELVTKNLTSAVTTVFNENYAGGMFSSLKKGLSVIKRTEWVFYHFVDQPLIPSDFYSSFVRQIEPSYDWIQPTYENAKGHPILFNLKVINLIKKGSDKTNLRELTEKQTIKKKYWNCGFKEILSDLNYPEDLKYYWKE